MRVVVVGSGLAGATAAFLLKLKGHNVEVFETRNTIGGNCYDHEIDGIQVHKYGAHVFHTNDTAVWGFMNQFTTFSNYKHKVLANTRMGRINIPFNKLSERITGVLTSAQARDLIFRDYSEKMWGVPLEKLPSAITDKVPVVREGFDSTYYTDKHQGIPLNGYTEMIFNMLSGIKVYLGAAPDAWQRAKRKRSRDLVIYTGPLDAYYDHDCGALQYRTLDFETMVGMPRQSAAVVTECNKLPYTRTVDHGFWTESPKSTTVLTRETPRMALYNDVPLYPMNFGPNPIIYDIYKTLRPTEPTIFLGRLATYKYYNMDQVVAQAMRVIKNLR